MSPNDVLLPTQRDKSLQCCCCAVMQVRWRRIVLDEVTSHPLLPHCACPCTHACACPRTAGQPAADVGEQWPGSGLLWINIDAQ